VINRALQTKPADGSTHWSARSDRCHGDLQNHRPPLATVLLGAAPPAEGVLSSLNAFNETSLASPFQRLSTKISQPNGKKRSSKGTGHDARAVACEILWELFVRNKPA
jgi:hypothetical protein